MAETVEQSGTGAFTVSIYCGNCMTVGEYTFPRGTRLHDEKSLYSDGPRFIRLINRYTGAKVPCQFCGVDDQLTQRSREESNG